MVDSLAICFDQRKAKMYHTLSMSIKPQVIVVHAYIRIGALNFIGADLQCTRRKRGKSPKSHRRPSDPRPLTVWSPTRISGHRLSFLTDMQKVLCFVSCVPCNVCRSIAHSCQLELLQTNLAEGLTAQCYSATFLIQPVAIPNRWLTGFEKSCFKILKQLAFTFHILSNSV